MSYGTSQDPHLRRRNDYFAHPEGSFSDISYPPYSELPFTSLKRRKQGTNFVKWTMRAVLASPMVVLVIWSFVAFAFSSKQTGKIMTNSSTSKQKRKSKTNTNAMPLEYYNMYNPYLQGQPPSQQQQQQYANLQQQPQQLYGAALQQQQLLQQQQQQPQLLSIQEGDSNNNNMPMMMQNPQAMMMQNPQAMMMQDPQQMQQRRNMMPPAASMAADSPPVLASQEAQNQFMMQNQQNVAYQQQQQQQPLQQQPLQQQQEPMNRVMSPQEFLATHSNLRKEGKTLPVIPPMGSAAGEAAKPMGNALVTQPMQNVMPQEEAAMGQIRIEPLQLPDGANITQANPMGKEAAIYYYYPEHAVDKYGNVKVPTVIFDRYGYPVDLKALQGKQVYMEPPRKRTIAAGPLPKWGDSTSQDQSIIVSTVAVMALLVGALSARRMRSRSFLSACIENESLEDDVAYDTAYTTTDHSYNTFGGWKGDLEKFDV